MDHNTWVIYQSVSTTSQPCNTKQMEELMTHIRLVTIKYRVRQHTAVLDLGTAGGTRVLFALVVCSLTTYPLRDGIPCV